MHVGRDATMQGAVGRCKVPLDDASCYWALQGAIGQCKVLLDNARVQGAIAQCKVPLDNARCYCTMQSAIDASCYCTMQGAIAQCNALLDNARGYCTMQVADKQCKCYCTSNVLLDNARRPPASDARAQSDERCAREQLRGSCAGLQEVMRQGVRPFLRGTVGMDDGVEERVQGVCSSSE
eukprot:gene12845-biopygen7969